MGRARQESERRGNRRQICRAHATVFPERDRPDVEAKRSGTGVNFPSKVFSTKTRAGQLFVAPARKGQLLANPIDRFGGRESHFPAMLARRSPGPHGARYQA